MLGATILTAFHKSATTSRAWPRPLRGALLIPPALLVVADAAIAYLNTLVPGITGGVKYAVVAGAVTGGGLTVITNAPHPAGQSILKSHFKNSVSPVGLLKADLSLRKSN